MNHSVMNIVCIICSELLKNEDIASTRCGHVFHRHCLENWLRNSETCPSCRRAPTVSSSLIKLFFEYDDNKGSLAIDEILKENEELTKELNTVKEKAAKLETDNRQIEQELKLAKETQKTSERQKSLDDMAIAGLKSIKEESSTEIVKMNHQIKSLSLDLLAERQLRRMHQNLLHDKLPQDENYDIANVQVNVAPMETSADVGSPKVNLAVPFWKLSCEAKQVEAGAKPKINYIVPSKIQKAAKESQDKWLGRKQAGVRKEMDRPLGYRFNAPQVTWDQPSSSQSSTSLPASSNQSVSFNFRKSVKPSTSNAVVSQDLSSGEPRSANPNSFESRNDSPTFLISTSPPTSTNNSTVQSPVNGGLIMGSNGGLDQVLELRAVANPDGSRRRHWPHRAPRTSNR